MKVLVTGANGFVGSHLCRQLRQAGAEVRGLVRQGSDRRLLEGQELELVEGDLRDPSAVEAAVADCEQVYHCAALVQFFVPDRAAMQATNVDGTRNVLEAARRAGVKRFVHTSTVAVLKRHSDGTPATEDQLLDAKDAQGAYEATKLEADLLAHQAAREGLPLVVVNATAPVGCGDYKPSPIGKVIINFLRGKIPAYTDTGLNLVDVRDLAAGHMLAAEKGRSGERYVLSGENLVFADFLRLLSELSGVPAPTVRIPYALALVGGLLGEVTGRLTRQDPLACLASVRTSKHPHYASCDKARAELGYDPRPVREALAEEIAWFREQGLV